MNSLGYCDLDWAEAVSEPVSYTHLDVYKRQVDDVGFGMFDHHQEPRECRPNGVPYAALGLLDIVENRLVGMKSRGVYENPGGAILYKAINVLETITLDKESSHFKAQLAQKYADIVYNGQWFTPLREALDAFADSMEKTVTGDVKLKLYKGNMINAGVTSPYTPVSYTHLDVYKRQLPEGAGTAEP